MKRGVGCMRRRFERIWQSRETCFILGGDGILYACGRNGHGQLGLGNRTDHSTFEPVKGIEGVVREMWLSGDTSFLLTDSGQLYACGWNSYGQLGLGDEASRHTFVPVKGVKKGTVREMWVTDYTSFLLSDSGQLYACGRNGGGQLGLGDGKDRSTFEPVKGIKKGMVREMWVSADTSFLLTEEGKKYGCGLPLGISIFKEAGGFPEEADFFLLEAERFEYSKNGTISLLSTFYDCLGLLAPYIEGGPIFEEGRGVYEKKV